MRHAHWITSVALVATAALSGCRTKGHQVVLEEGTPITFTTNEAVAVRP